jgi:hypothetical protein
MDTLRKVAPGIRLNLFLILPQDDTWIRVFFWVCLMSAVFLTIGFLTRFNSIFTFVCLASLHQRNFYILHAGDTLLRVMGFFLMFAPAGMSFSVDRLWRIWRGKEGYEIQPRSPWAMRMMQIQTSMLYFSTFYAKTVGHEWIDGTALYFTTRLAEFRRFPIPALNAWIFKLATWSVLFVEFSLAVLVWIREFRYWILLLGLCLHLSIEYSMNVPLFQWIILAGYVMFIDPADLSRASAWLRQRVAKRLSRHVDVIYDSTSPRMIRLATLLRTVDIFQRLNFVHGHSFENGQTQRLLIRDTSGDDPQTSIRRLLLLSRSIPLFWPLAPLSILFRRKRQALKIAVQASK